LRSSSKVSRKNRSSPSWGSGAPLRLRALTAMCSPRLPVGRVLAAPPAVLLQLQAVRVVFLVLDRRVVAPFAVAALKGDDRFHRSLCRWGLGCWVVEVEKRSPGSPRRRQWYHLFGRGKPAGHALPSPAAGE